MLCIFIFSGKMPKYNQENVAKALQELEEGGSLRKVAARHGIPHTTLQDWRKGKYGHLPHPNRALMPEEEEALVGYIFWMAAHGFPITRSVALLLATEICKASGRTSPLVNMEKGLSKMWWTRFRARHPTVASRRPDPLDRERVHGATVARVDELFRICQALYQQHGFGGTPAQIYNCDETGFGDKGHSRQRVLCRKGQRHVYAQQVTTRDHVTVHCCANAAGESIPPFIIFQGCLPSTAYSLEGPSNALYGVSERGYMDSDLFVKWLGHFIKHARQERPLLLFMDQHEAHVGKGVVDFCRANQVEVVCLPAHTTHVLQPLDVAVYGSLKAAFSRLAREMGLVRGDLVLGKRHFSAVLKYAVEQACTPNTIKSGFRSTGLFPLDRTAVDDSKLVKGLRDPNHLPSDTDEDPEDLPDVADVSTAGTADAAAHTRSATTSTTSAADTGTVTAIVLASSTAVECAPSPVSSPWGPADPAATTVPTPCSPNASSSSTTTTTSAAAAAADPTTSAAAAAAGPTTSAAAAAAGPTTSAAAAAADPTTSAAAAAAAGPTTSAAAAAADPTTSAAAAAAAGPTTSAAAAAADPTTSAAAAAAAAGLADILVPPHFDRPTRGRRRMPLPARVITADAYAALLAEREEEDRRKEAEKRERAAQRLLRQQQVAERAAERAAQQAERAAARAAQQEQRAAQQAERAAQQAERAAARAAQQAAREQRESAQAALRAAREDPEQYCTVCKDIAPPGSSRDLHQWLQCDLCTLWYHTECLEVGVVPEGEWYCHKCQDSVSLQVALELEL
ncbi:uncharacterized protein LOC143117477 [Alosa pseudoharengus]|uniref:uncharacterized protein LOC143117477 n=1 Tax=Alosa pseudoharengus TaxID=34774 RepID=UPI003F8BB4AD